MAEFKSMVRAIGTGPASVSYRVVRCGSWYSSGTYLRSANRNFNSPSDRFYDIGFRVGFKASKQATDVAL